MLVVEGLTCRFGTKAAVDNASFSIAARQLRRRDRPLRRRQVDAAAHDQPPRRTDRRPHPVRGRRCHGAAGQELRAVARALGDDLPAVQPGRPARRADQRADGPARRQCRPGARWLQLWPDDDKAHRDVGARAVRHGAARGAARRPAFRRPAAARRDCPRAGAGAGHHPRRRADRLARSAQHPDRDGRAAAHQQAFRHHRDLQPALARSGARAIATA